MLDPGRPFLISPPFGTWLRHPRAYSVRGSFTRDRRPGRLGQVLRTVRPVPCVLGPAWINKVGLRNPGISGLPARFPPHVIVSLAPLEDTDWHAFERWLDERFSHTLVEFNVSCPNVSEHPSLPPEYVVRRLLVNCPDAIWKVPPVEGAKHTIMRLCDLGARYMHVSNTLASPIGGISGAPLREGNLRRIEWAAGRGYDVELIAGGGIYSAADVESYRSAGATRFSLATAWFWPPRAIGAMLLPKE